MGGGHVSVVGGHVSVVQVHRMGIGTARGRGCVEDMEGGTPPEQPGGVVEPQKTTLFVDKRTQKKICNVSATSLK